MKTEKMKDEETTTKLVVAVDLGRLRAFRLEAGGPAESARLSPMEEMLTAATRHFSDELTDQFGRFRKEPAITGAGSDGEEHNLDLERRHRAIKQLAERITFLLNREKVAGCYFAADPRINQLVLDQLAPAVRSQILKNIPYNLTKLAPAEIGHRFLQAAPRSRRGSSPEVRDSMGA